MSLDPILFFRKLVLIYLRPIFYLYRNQLIDLCCNQLTFVYVNETCLKQPYGATANIGKFSPQQPLQKWNSIRQRMVITCKSVKLSPLDTRRKLNVNKISQITSRTSSGVSHLRSIYNRMYVQFTANEVPPGHRGTYIFCPEGTSTKTL